MKSRILLIDNKFADFGTPEKFGNRLFISSGCTPKKYTGLQYRSSFSFKYVFKGEEDFLVEGKQKKITTGQSLLINDGSETHFLYSNGYATSIFIEPEIVIDVHNTCSNEFVSFEYPFDPRVPYLELYDGVTNHNYKFIDKLRSATKIDLVITKDFYYEIAHEILRKHNSIYKKINRIDSTKPATRKELYKRIDIARQSLLASIGKSFNLDEISKEACLSKFHLIRTFKEVYGITPHKFFIKKKIEAAKSYYLKNREHETLLSTAFRFGYPDYPSFSKQFKAVEGYPPSLLNL